MPPLSVPPLSVPPVELTVVVTAAAIVHLDCRGAWQHGQTPLDLAYEWELDYRPKHSGARHSTELLRILERASGGVREDL